jgi:hypothetical protein
MSACFVTDVQRLSTCVLVLSALINILLNIRNYDTGRKLDYLQKELLTRLEILNRMKKAP